MTYEYAYAQAVNEFNDWHGDPTAWKPWEVEYYPKFVAARVAELVADVTDPGSIAEAHDEALAQATAGGAR